MKTAARVLLAALLAAAPAGRADGSSVKEGFKKFGREVGQAGKEVGKGAAELGKQAWYKGKRVSKPKLQAVHDKTEAYWKKFLDDADKALAALRKENEELKKKAKS